MDLLARFWVVFGAHILLFEGSLGLLAHSRVVLGVHVLLSGVVMGALGLLVHGLVGPCAAACGVQWPGPNMATRREDKPLSTSPVQVFYN